MKRRKHVVNPSVLLQDEDYLNVPQAHDWILKWYNVELGTRAIYRYIIRGRLNNRCQRRKLNAIKVCGQWTVKKEWIISFIEEMAR